MRTIVFSEKFAWSSDLTKLTDEWMVTNTSGNCVSTATVDVVRTDADSGTFSSEDDEEETDAGTMTDTLATSSQNGDGQQTDHIRVSLFIGWGISSDTTFIYFLTSFFKLMPHPMVLYNQYFGVFIVLNT